MSERTAQKLILSLGLFAIIVGVLNLLILWDVITIPSFAHQLLPRTTDKTGFPSNNAAPLSASDRDEAFYAVVGGALSRNSSAQTLAASGQIDCDDWGIVTVAGSGGDVTLTSDPQILTPTDLPTTKWCVIEGSSTNRLTLVDGSGLDLGDHASITLGTNAGDSSFAVFVYNGTDWFLISENSGLVTKTYGPFTADNMTAEGNCTITTDTAIVSGGLVVPYVTCADITGDQFWVGPIPMPDGWNLGTVVWKGRAVNVAATPASDTDAVSISGTCWGSDDAFPTSISTTGQQACTIDWTSFTQNDDGQCVTSAITLNGTPAASDVCMFLFDVTDAGTDVASVKWHTFWMEYTWNQTGD